MILAPFMARSRPVTAHPSNCMPRIVSAARGGVYEPLAVTGTVSDRPFSCIKPEPVTAVPRCATEMVEIMW